jgi:predicted nucleic acid-binding protein
VKLEEALRGVTALGFDTAPLIYFVERHSTYVDIMRTVIQQVDTGQIAGFSSVITLTEVLTLPKRLANKQLEEEYRILLTQSRNFSIVIIDPIVAEQAAEMRAKYNLRTPDALQLASAVSAGCQAFLTNDANLKRVRELRIVVLEDLES